MASGSSEAGVGRAGRTARRKRSRPATCWACRGEKIAGDAGVELRRDQAVSAGPSRISTSSATATAKMTTHGAAVVGAPLRLEDAALSPPPHHADAAGLGRGGPLIPVAAGGDLAALHSQGRYQDLQRRRPPRARREARGERRRPEFSRVTDSTPACCQPG